MPETMFFFVLKYKICRDERFLTVRAYSVNEAMKIVDEEIPVEKVFLRCIMQMPDEGKPMLLPY